MQKRFFLLYLLSFCTFSIFIVGRASAQSEDKAESVDMSEFTDTKSVTRLYLPYPALEAEFSIAPVTTLRAGGLIGLYYQSINGVTNSLSIFPILNGGLNHYLNVKRRLRKGKRVDKFSANYLYGSGTVQLSRTPALGVGVGYGLNRNIGGLGFWGVSFGMQYLINGYARGIRPNLGLGIGLSFPRAKAAYIGKTKKK